MRTKKPVRPTKYTRTKTLVDLAYNAMERESFSDDPETAKAADEAMARLGIGKSDKPPLTRNELLRWASREWEYRSLTDNDDEQDY